MGVGCVDKPSLRLRTVDQQKEAEEREAIGVKVRVLGESSVRCVEEQCAFNVSA